MRAMFRAGGFVIALATLIVAGRLWAESKERKPVKPTPRTRVALFNLTYVIRNYDKYKHSQEELRATIKPFEKQMEGLRAQQAKLKNEMRQGDLTPTKKEKIMKKSKMLQRQMEDLDSESKLVLGTKRDAQMEALYLDVSRVAQNYATAHDFDLLLHYHDATTEEDMNSVQNISRKLNTGGLTPIYSAPGIDISKDVIAELNHKEGAAQ